jgi:hypothetical protein
MPRSSACSNSMLSLYTSLGNLLVIQAVSCGGRDLQFADHRKVRQGLHASSITASMDVVRQVHARLPHHDSVKFDLAAWDQSLPLRVGVQVLEDRLSGHAVNPELADQVVGEPRLERCLGSNGVRACPCEHFPGGLKLGCYVFHEQERRAS